MYNNQDAINASRSNVFIRNLILVMGFVCLLLSSIPGNLHAASMWEADPPMLAGDPQWDKVKDLWKDHYDGKNLDELIAILTPLKDKTPDKVEPYLCLARAHYLHARYINKDKAGHFAKSENYAVQALKIDPNNNFAIRALMDTLIWSRDRNYIFSKYGELLKAKGRIKLGDPCPVPDYMIGNYPESATFKKLWAERGDMEKLKACIPLIEKMADAHPNDIYLQMWASYVDYYIGEVHTSYGLEEHNTKGIPYYKRGLAYARKAMKLDPKNYLANYCVVMNQSRIIQFTSLMNKARYLMDFVTPLLYATKENCSLFFFNPFVILGNTLIYGGWVTEKGFGMANINKQMVFTALEITEMVYPEFMFTPQVRAELLYTMGNKKEAMAILTKLLARDPGANKLVPENQTYYRIAKGFYEDIQSGKR